MLSVASPCSILPVILTNYTILFRAKAISVFHIINRVRSSGCSWRGGAWHDDARPGTEGTVIKDVGVFEKVRIPPQTFITPANEKLLALFNLNRNALGQYEESF